jgi:hypothetical protein
MKTLKKLAEEIQKSPSDYKTLLGSFKTKDPDLQKFLASMIELDRTTVIAIPAMINAFGKSYKQYDEPKTLGDLVEVAEINTYFVTQDGEDYALAGAPTGNTIPCKEINTGLIMDLDKDTLIKWIF